MGLLEVGLQRSVQGLGRDTVSLEVSQQRRVSFGCEWGTSEKQLETRVLQQVQWEVAGVELRQALESFVAALQAVVRWLVRLRTRWSVLAGAFSELAYSNQRAGYPK